MPFSDYIIHLSSKFKSGSSQEHASDLDNLIRKLIPALEALNKEKVRLFQTKTGLTFVPEKEPEGQVCYLNNQEVRSDYKFTFASIDILDYIYAALHSNSYREKYNDFLRSDFPWVPYPKNTDTFWKLVELGVELRQTHLMESPKIGQLITQYPVSGTNMVDKIRFTIYDYEQSFPGKEYPNYLGTVYINANQYFADVPVSVWELSIGGTQPAQKWVSKRKGKILSDDDIIHYQKIIVALEETNRLMNEVDKIAID